MRYLCGLFVAAGIAILVVAGAFIATDVDSQKATVGFYALAPAAGVLFAVVGALDKVAKPRNRVALFLYGVGIAVYFPLITLAR